MTQWTTKPLGEIADLCLGKMLDEKKNRGDLLPYLANINVRWGEFDFTNLRKMRFEQKEKDKYGLKYGDIVMCEGGEPGRCALWKDHNQSMTIQKALHRIRPHKYIDSHFLYYYLLHTGRRGAFSSLFTGSAIKHLPKEKLEQLNIRYPTIELQHNISSILINYDDLIENNRRRIALLEQSARLLYQEWFVRLRFPGHEKVKIADGVPEGWAREKLHEIAGVNLNSIEKTYSGEIEYIDISSVSTGNIDATTYYDFKTAPSRARRLVNDGDIIWSCVRPNRKSYAIMTKPKSNLVVSTGFVVITPTKVPTAYLYHAITTDNYVEYLTKHARGAAYPAVTASDFENSFILVPSQELLNLFDKYTQELLILKYTLSIQNERLAAARDLLLPRLMSGEIAV